MILERRVLVFPRADFLDAMRRYGERVGKVMPNAAPENIHFDPSQDVALAVTFAAARGGVATRYTFSCEDVGQALTTHCREYKVPLPKGANKQVEKYKDGAALTMQMGETGLHVMIIDDQEVIRTIIRKSLAKANPSRIIEATNGKDALDLLRKGDVDPDVILCDLHMETMGGDEFLRQLRADKTNRNSRKPVLILTGDKSEQVHEAIRQMGASKVLTKPIAPDELIRQIMLVRGYFELNKSA
ncbi:MAG: response regulator [Rhodospirillaceae bacterium]|nr:response regulator [Rhodospirillales bacterium]